MDNPYVLCKVCSYHNTVNLISLTRANGSVFEIWKQEDSHCENCGNGDPDYFELVGVEGAHSITKSLVN